MTVRDLIDKLSEMPLEANVYVLGGTPEITNVYLSDVEENVVIIN